jgi:hypothetical protein
MISATPSSIFARGTDLLFVGRRQRGSACERYARALPAAPSILARGMRSVSVPNVPTSRRLR